MLKCKLRTTNEGLEKDFEWFLNKLKATKNLSSKHAVAFVRLTGTMKTASL